MTALPSSLPPLGSLLLLAAVQTVSDTDPATLAGRSARSEARERAAARRYAAGRALDRARRARLTPSSPLLIVCEEGPGDGASPSYWDCEQAGLARVRIIGPWLRTGR